MNPRLLWILAMAACRPRPALDFAEPPKLDDEDPSDGRFEATLTAARTSRTFDGQPVDFLAYNGSVPGPQLRVKVGDEVLVHFVNDLPTDADWASGVHWHGIEGYNAADGTPVTQMAVGQGAAFDYRFVATRPGIYWYHPHIRGAQALFSGLYAPLIVEDPAEAELVARGVLPADDRVLQLSDTWVSQGRITSAEVDDPMEIMNGTEGRSLLVNGELAPTLEVAAGSAVRLRVINSSITRFWRLSVPGHTLYRVGGEGGLLDAVRVEGGTVTGERFDVATGASRGPAEVDLGYPRGQIVLGPGDRADVVLVTDGAPGEQLELRWEDVARGRHDMFMDGDTMVMEDAEDDGARPGETVATFVLVDRGAAPFSIAEGDPLLAAVGRSVTVIDDTGARDWSGDAGTSLDEEMGSVQREDGSWEMTMSLGMNRVSWMPDHHAGPDQAEAPTAKHAKLGDTLRWEVHNRSRMAHPYHLHGFSFQPVEWVQWPDPETEDDGTAVRVPWTFAEFADTEILPGFSSLFFRVTLDDPAGDGSAAGRWMQHCHILQHGENGMMSELVVAP